MPRKKTFAAIRVRGTAQFDSGINYAGSPITPKREYLALISQTGNNDPNVQVIHSNLNGSITWTRYSTGFYQGVSTETFYMQNCIITLQGFLNNGTPLLGCRAYVAEGKIIIHTFNIATGLETDDGLSETPIRIEVYDIPFEIPPELPQ